MQTVLGDHASWPAARGRGRFGTFATIALVAAISAFVLAALMALLVAFGFGHARRTDEATELAVHTATST